MKRRQTAHERKIEWNTAIAEGRMLISQNGLSFQAFRTRSDALAAVIRIQLAGMEAEIVDPSLAIREYVIAKP